MKMGRERAVVRWYVRDALLRQRIAKLEQQLAAAEGQQGARESERSVRLAAELADLQRQMRALGPSPQAKMG